MNGKDGREDDNAGVDREALEEIQSRMETAAVTHRNEEVRLELRNWADELDDLLTEGDDER